MKPKFQLECIDKECRTITIAKGNEHLDGIRCPRCNGPVLSKPFKPKPVKVTERTMYVRGKILEYNKEHCFDLTSDQVETVLDLYDGYKEENKEGVRNAELGNALRIGDTQPPKTEIIQQFKMSEETGEGLSVEAFKSKLLKDTRDKINQSVIEDHTKLLVIELDSYGSVPRVLFEGEEIKRMIDLKFKWETDTSVPKPPRIFIKHADKECGEKPIPIKTISFEPIS